MRAIWDHMDPGHARIRPATVLKGVEGNCRMSDTEAKPDQLTYLVENHGRVAERCRQAYEAAAIVGDRLQ